MEMKEIKKMHQKRVRRGISNWRGRSPHRIARADQMAAGRIDKSIEDYDVRGDEDPVDHFTFIRHGGLHDAHDG